MINDISILSILQNITQIYKLNKFTHRPLCVDILISLRIIQNS